MRSEKIHRNFEGLKQASNTITTALQTGQIDFMKELAANLTEGPSALFILFRKATPDKVLERIKGFKAKILQTSLAVEAEDELRKVLEG